VLIRRGRKGRGFTVCPVEDISNPAVCASAGELGEVIEEMLNDEEQPRVDVNELLQAASDPGAAAEPEPQKSRAKSKQEPEPEPEPEEDEDEEEDDGIFAGVAGSDDPATALLINFAHSALAQGRKMSSKKARARAGKKKKTRRT
jgi:hypothetical protein